MLHLLKPDRRIEDAETSFFLPDHAKVVPPQPVVECEFPRELPIVLQIDRVVILIRVALGIADRLTTSVDGAGEKVLNAVERELRAIASVEEPVYERAAELVPEFVVVRAGRVSDVSDELIIRVHTTARQRSVRSDGREARN